nr:Tn3 family transposase [Fischerella sp. PCC 9605]
MPQNRLLQLAREGSRYTNQKLRKFEQPRRYAVLVAFLAHQLQELIDRALSMHDRLMTTVFNHAKRKHQEEFQNNGKAINEKVRLYVSIGKALIAARENEQDWISAIESVIPWERFVATVLEAEKLAYPYAFDYLDHLDNHYSYLRQYTPLLLESFEFQAAKPYTSITQAIDVLRQLNETGQRTVPETAPVDFIKPRWQEHIFQADKIDRHYYELCILATLKDGLNSGDLSVKGSKQYRNFDDYLLPPSDWSALQQQQQIPITIPTDCQTYLEQRSQELDEALKNIEPLLVENKLTDVRLEDEKLIITPLTKLVPEEAEKLSHQIYQLLPRIKLTDLLIEVDAWTNFSGHFTHLHTDQESKQKRLLLSTILADATNLGYTRLAEACPGISAEQLSWTSQWYLRPETYSKALATLVNFQHQLPMAQLWGDGTTSSSDGQSFRIANRRPYTAHINAKYGFDPTVVFYTHISDQYAPYHTKVISSIVRDAPHMLDGLLYHETDLTIREHYTDTAGFTDQVFAICHLLGFHGSTSHQQFERP